MPKIQCPCDFQGGSDDQFLEHGPTYRAGLALDTTVGLTDEAMARKLYEERTDLEKVQSQWHKLSGLHTREEWSAAIVRAATAAEIAANFAIRAEFTAQSELDPAFVDSLLRWANGLAGKLDRLLVPVTTASKKKNKTIKALCAKASEINKKRNAVAHQGEFCSEDEARAVISTAHKFITTLVRLYEPTFVLKQRKT